MKHKTDTAPAATDKPKQRGRARRERIDAKLQADPRAQELVALWTVAPYEERAKRVGALHGDGYPIRAIARLVGVNERTISDDCRIARLGAGKKRRIARGESKTDILYRARRRGEVLPERKGRKRRPASAKGERLAQVAHVDRYGSADGNAATPRGQNLDTGRGLPCHPADAALADLRQRRARLREAADSFVTCRPDPAVIKAQEEEQARRVAEAGLKEVEEKRLIMKTGRTSAGEIPRGWRYPTPTITLAGPLPAGQTPEQALQEWKQNRAEREQAQAEKIRRKLGWAGPCKNTDEEPK